MEEVFPYTYKVRTFSSRLAELVRVGLECFKYFSILIPRQKKKKKGRERKRGQDAGGVWYGMVAFVHNHRHHHHKILYITGRDEMMTSGNSARRVGICGSPFLGIVREGRCSIISHTSGTPAFGQDINGSNTIINIATTILSYYISLNFGFHLLGGLTFDVKVALAGNAKLPPPPLPLPPPWPPHPPPLTSTSAPGLAAFAAFTALAADAKSTWNFVFPADLAFV